MTPRKSLSRNLFLLLLVVCLCARIVHWSIARPKIYPDSSEYITVASSILNCDFHGYTGERTAGYPLFLLLAGLDPVHAWVLQSFLGIATSLLLFAIVLRQTRDPFLGFLAGMAHSLSINVLFFESDILTETLATFLLVFCLFLLFRLFDLPRRGWRMYALMGLVAGVAAFVKPLLMYVPPLLAIILLVRWRIRGLPPGHLPGRLVGFALPPIILLGGWSLFNRVTVDYFGTTTLLGYNLTQHTGELMEDAPVEYAGIRDIFLRYRNQRISLSGSPAFAVFDAREEMMRTTGTSVAGLSKLLTGLGLRLIVRHPFAYLRSVAVSWWDFWSVPLYWDRYAISPLKAGRILETLWGWQKYVIFGLRLAFLGTVLARTVHLLRRRGSLLRMDSAPAIWILGTVVMLGSLVQACLESGENARYSLPFQSLMITYLVLAIAPYFTRIHRAGDPGDQENSDAFPDGPVRARS
jgi:hypothetical protein